MTAEGTVPAPDSLGELWAGRRIIVTGSAHGIGQGVVRRAAELGARVAIVDFDRPASEALEEELTRAGRDALAVVTDVTNADSVEQMAAAVEGRFGGVDVLVNAAGGFTRSLPFDEISDADWRRVMDLNLYTTFACCRAVVPRMKAAGRGRVVNVSSDAGRMPTSVTAAHYAAAKAAIIGLTKHLALELAPHGVAVNAVAPATTLTDRVRKLYTPEVVAKLSALTPIGRLAEVEDQVHPILFLASEQARYITGATLDVNGGRLML